MYSINQSQESWPWFHTMTYQGLGQLISFVSFGSTYCQNWMWLSYCILRHLQNKALKALNCIVWLINQGQQSWPWLHAMTLQGSRQMILTASFGSTYCRNWVWWSRWTRQGRSEPWPCTCQHPQRWHFSEAECNRQCIDPALWWPPKSTFRNKVLDIHTFKCTREWFVKNKRIIPSEELLKLLDEIYMLFKFIQKRMFSMPSGKMFWLHCNMLRSSLPIF